MVPNLRLAAPGAGCQHLEGGCTIRGWRKNSSLITGILKQTNLYCSYTAHCLKSGTQKMVKFLAQSTYIREAQGCLLALRFAWSQGRILRVLFGLSPASLQLGLNEKKKLEENKTTPQIHPCSRVFLKSPK